MAFVPSLKAGNRRGATAHTNQQVGTGLCV